LALLVYQGFRGLNMFITIDSSNVALINELAQLTYLAFKVHAPNWLPTATDAKRQVLRATETDRINRVLLSPHATPIGWIGVIPINHGRIWEIHPLAIAPAQQGHGSGRMLVQEIERLAAEHGVLGLMAGTSDETGATPLYGIDLYQNPFEVLNKLDSTENHPVVFWKKIGFTIVGVVPDAEGRGKPAISLAKRIG
jgi:aminoglycoside 6'-N-acetyltransferase I